MIGLSLGWTFAARYGDAVLLLPVALLALLRLTSIFQERLRLLAVAGLGAMLFIVWVGWLHNSVFGSPFITPYRFHIDAITGRDGQDWGARSITYAGYHLFSLLINPHVFDQTIKFVPMMHSLADRPMLSYYFVSVLSGVGLAFLWRQNRGLVVSFGLSLGLALVYYGTYWSTAAHDLRFHNLRFFAPWEPMLVCVAIAGLIGLLRADWRSWAERSLIGIGVSVALLLGIGLYGLGRLFPPFPDTARLVPPLGWSVSANAALKDLAKAIDHNIATGWHPQGIRSAGTYFAVDMGRAYRLDQLFLARRVDSTSGPVSVGVEVSLDGEHWTVPANLRVDSPEERILAFDFEPTVARHSRFYLLADSTEAGWAIDEIYAYGQPASEP
jgi:hypothetical protein